MGSDIKNYRPLFLLGALFFALLTPWPYLIDGIVLTSVLTVLLFVVCRWMAPFSWTKALMASIVVIFMLYTDQTVAGGAKSQRLVAFVLREENNRLEILVDRNRTIIFIPEDIVVRHQICNLNTNPMGSAPLIQLLSGHRFEGHVPSCWRETDQPAESRRRAPR